MSPLTQGLNYRSACDVASLYCLQCIIALPVVIVICCNCWFVGQFVRLFISRAVISGKLQL